MPVHGAAGTVACSACPVGDVGVTNLAPTHTLPSDMSTVVFFTAVLVIESIVHVSIKKALVAVSRNFQNLVIRGFGIQGLVGRSVKA